MIVLPEALKRKYAGEWALAYQASPTVATWRVATSTGEAIFVKVGRSDDRVPVLVEAQKMRWARPYLPVADVLEAGTDAQFDWLVTTALPGKDATDSSFKAYPAELVAALGRGLLQFHNLAPVRDCPYGLSIDDAIEIARHRVASRQVNVAEHFHAEHRHFALEAALAELERIRPEGEDLVVCHGDYCFPNVLLTGGVATGYVDLGDLAVSDRWWDLAVGAWSTTWNIGPGWERLFYESYGIDPEPSRIRFFRLLYDLIT